MEAVVLNVPGITSVPDIKGIYETVIKDPRELSWPPDDRREAYLDYERLSLPLAVTCRWAGARFRPLGMDGRKKKLKDYLIDRKIPRQERDHLPLVVSGTDIAWVTGLGIACLLYTSIGMVIGGASSGGHFHGLALGGLMPPPVEEKEFPGYIGGAADSFVFTYTGIRNCRIT